ncbi:hypothetical protein DFH07DRAFT_843568 [Mycena maculata]|uniref:GATA-type domain-containing protein n=1 Tax=Mycena maculata TaxID=230809 RepID=A0AAD7MW15_9AGAR|nr:hypothetical protein DFH07DRAFT_843568 [Mycena maculata]
MTLIPFSPSFSPIPLSSALESDSHFLRHASGSGSPDDWIDHRKFDPKQQSPQWSAMPTYPQDSWNSMAVPALDFPTSISRYPTYDSTAPRTHILPRSSSPSEDSSGSGRLSPLSVFASSASSSRRGSMETPKRCSHCDATSTPLWRRHPGTHQTLCNACGLYLQQRKKLRPRVLIAAEQEEEDDPDTLLPDGPECSHCHGRKTSVWRRSKSGARLCNACGVYARLRGKDRPLSLRRNKVRPRCKHVK